VIVLFRFAFLFYSVALATFAFSFLLFYFFIALYSLIFLFPYSLLLLSHSLLLFSPSLPLVFLFSFTFFALTSHNWLLFCVINQKKQAFQKIFGKIC